MPRMPKPPAPPCEHYPVSASEDAKLKLLESKLVPRDLSSEIVETAAADSALIYIDDNHSSKVITVANLLSAAKGISFKVVQSLPEVGQTNVIYLVPKSGTTQDVYDEYIWVEKEGTYQWEKIGSTSVDLSEYAKMSWVNAQGFLKEHQDISSKADKTYVDAQLEQKASTSLLNEKVDLLSSNIMSEASARQDADNTLSNRINVYESNKANYDDAVNKKHEHSNKTLLDTVETKNLLTDDQIALINKIENKADTSYVTEQLNKKQEKIIAGDNISINADNKTINALDQKIGHTFTTGVQVGNLAKGTEITESMLLKEILYTILNKISVASVSLDKHNINLDVNSSTTITATLTPISASDPTILWEITSGSDVIALTGSGNTRSIKGLKSGSATLVAKSQDDPTKSDTCVITVVYYPVTSVTLAKHTTDIKVGNVETLTCTVLPENATNKNVTWSTSNSAIATVTQTGVVTGVAVGTANITATSVDNPDIKDSCTVTISKVDVTQVTLNKTATTLEVGGIETLTATVRPNNATNKKVNWSSSNEAVATVDQTGKITAIGSGTATIYAKSDDNAQIQATCTVTIASSDIEIKYGGCGAYCDGTALYPSDPDYAIYIDGDINRMTTQSVNEAALIASDGYEVRMTITTATLPCEEEWGVADGQYPSVLIPNTYYVDTIKDADSKETLTFNHTTYGTGNIWYCDNTYVAKGVSKGLLLTIKKGV